MLTKKTKKKVKKALRMPTAINESPAVFDFETDANWRVFKIMSEFVHGWQFLATLKKEISFFGSNRLSPDNKYYKLAEQLAYKLGKDKYTIITRGGYGIMEAANKGATRAGAESISLNLLYPKGTHQNEYSQKNLIFSHYFTQKVMMNASAQAYVFFPGGYGTLDSFSEFVTLIQTLKMEKIPIILVGKDFWPELLGFIEEILLKKFKTISPEDVNIYTYVGDDIDKAYKIIKKTKERQFF